MFTRPVKPQQSDGLSARFSHRRGREREGERDRERWREGAGDVTIGFKELEKQRKVLQYYLIDW